MRLTISLRLIAVLALCLGLPARADMLTTGAGGTKSAALPGPPTFTFVTYGLLSCSGGVCTASGVSIGSAFSNRLVYVFVISGNTFGPWSACSIGGSACTMTYNAGTGTNFDWGVGEVAIPSGTTANLSFTYSSNPSLVTTYWVYTVDSTTLNSTTPTGSNIVNVASGTTVTGTLSGITSGSAVFFGLFLNGVTNNSQAVSSSSCSAVQDNIFNATAAGHVNNVSGSSCNVVETWSTSTSGGAIGMLAIR